MHRVALLCSLLLLMSFSVAAQEKSKSKDSAPPIPSFSTRLPSEETVNAFMKQMFGYDPAVSWKVVSIRPTDAQGISEVLVVVSSPQGQQTNRFVRHRRRQARPGWRHYSLRGASVRPRPR